MNGLKPFRHIPTNLVEWSKWMRDQDLVNSSSLDSAIESASTTSTSTSTSTTTEQRWIVEDFDGNYTLRDADDGKILRSISASATNFTVEGGWLNGENGQVVILQYGAGTVTVVASGATIRTPSTLVINEQYGSVTLIQIDTDEFMIAGRMSP